MHLQEGRVDFVTHPMGLCKVAEWENFWHLSMLESTQKCRPSLQQEPPLGRCKNSTANPASPWELLSSTPVASDRSWIHTEMQGTRGERERSAELAATMAQPDQMANNKPLQSSTGEKQTHILQIFPCAHCPLSSLTSRGVRNKTHFVEKGAMETISRKSNWCRLYFVRSFPFACIPEYIDYPYYHRQPAPDTEGWNAVLLPAHCGKKRHQAWAPVHSPRDPAVPAVWTPNR